MLRLLTVSLAGVAATFMSFGVSATKAIAQTVFPFEAIYNTISVFEEDILTSDSTAFSRGRVRYSGSILSPQAVPEPRNITTLVGIGVIGVGLLVRRRRLGVVG